ncbi:MAG: tetratricopeptide repeat protein [Magnetococcales bacterium]|nr:tetratricopeptide repeat protein [Magnetococcales bacterium]
MRTADEAYKEALDSVNSGRYSDAEELCCTVLKDIPNHIDAINLLGIVAQKTGRHDLAVEQFNRALCINNGSEFLYYNLASSLYKLGETRQAVAALQQAIAINPEFFHAYCSLGYGQRVLGRFDEAATSYQKAIFINPNDADAHNNLGISLQTANKTEQAIECYRKAIAIRPDYVVAMSNLGFGLQILGRLSESCEILQKAIAIDPNYADAHYNLGVTLHEQKLVAEAIASYQKAIAINPNDAKVHFNCANCLKEQNNYAAAILSYGEAIRINPDYADAYNNLGVVLQEVGEFDKADINYQKAIAIRPDFADAHHNLSLDELVRGDLINGWVNYNWRWLTKHHDRERFLKFEDRMWLGGDVTAKRFLLWAEQGIGESIIFSTMFADLIEQGAKIVIECDPRLIPLFGRTYLSAVCVAKGDKLTVEGEDNRFDYIMPFGNLSPVLRGDLKFFPKKAVHLLADEDKKQAIRERYLNKNSTDILVGISWHSNSPKYRDKSLKLADLKPLLSLPNIVFVDLQYGDTTEERGEFTRDTAIEIIHDDDVEQMVDLDSFAAQVAAMDVVVTISNTTAHMAGALGVETLLLLGKFSLWYWMMDREDSPWYSCANLFRQQKQGEWEDVVGDVTRRLKETVRQR